MDQRRKGSRTLSPWNGIIGGCGKFCVSLERRWADAQLRHVGCQSREFYRLRSPGYIGSSVRSESKWTKPFSTFARFFGKFASRFGLFQFSHRDLQQVTGKRGVEY